ncbi:hypothetical protein [Streptomyces zaehneri]|uniref:hypothetical protein n=1 Tax=Streptomyces zaehneri TaxID=3051180 RepID=UPI0028CFF8C4|nr:hypothetical protein [Streptomyces sp. DSM 40713]
MSDSTRISTLEQQVKSLQQDVNRKPDATLLDAYALSSEIQPSALTGSGAEPLATQKYVDDKTKSSMVKSLAPAAFSGLALPTGSIASLALGSVVSIGVGSVIAAALPALWSLSAVIEKRLEKKFIVRRENGFLWKESDAQKAQRLIREGLPGKIKNANKRIGYLEKNVAQLKRRSNVARQSVRHLDASPSLVGATDRVQILEVRVRLLAEALG